jgi:hypothetical protein
MNHTAGLDSRLDGHGRVQQVIVEESECGYQLWEGYRVLEAGVDI